IFALFFPLASGSPASPVPLLSMSRVTRERRHWVGRKELGSALSRSRWQKSPILGPSSPSVPDAERLCYSRFSVRRDARHLRPKRKYRAYRSRHRAAQKAATPGRTHDSSSAAASTTEVLRTQALVPQSAPVVPDWRLDPQVAAQVEETLSCLTIKRRRFLKRLIETGHQRQAVYEAGYHPSSPASATAMAQEILQSPATQHALHALIAATGLSARKLDEIHAIHLGRHSSVDGGDRDRSFTALALARKYLQPKGAVTAPGSVADQVFDQMTSSELEAFARTGAWPARFKDVLTGEAAITDM